MFYIVFTVGPHNQQARPQVLQLWQVQSVRLTQPTSSFCSAPMCRYVHVNVSYTRTLTKNSLTKSLKKFSYKEVVYFLSVKIYIDNNRNICSFKEKRKSSKRMNIYDAKCMRSNCIVCYNETFRIVWNYIISFSHTF